MIYCNLTIFNQYMYWYKITFIAEMFLFSFLREHILMNERLKNLMSKN